MRKLLNTLYVTRQESYLHKERETIVIENGNAQLGQFPASAIGHIICFGQISVSPFLMGYCGEHGIGLTFLTEHGRFLARVQGRQSGNVLLRRSQYRWADDAEKSAAIARLIVAAKIANSRSVLLREIRNHGENSIILGAADRLASSLRRARLAQSVSETMGIEGEAASAYFAVFEHLLRASGFAFDGRVRRPPTDPVNSLLSFIYSLITQECSSALQGVGLDPYVGFLHQDRPGRVSLALDLLEEFRAPWADRFVLTLINRRQIQPSDFATEASGAVLLTEDARKMLLVQYQERKRVEIEHHILRSASRSVCFRTAKRCCWRAISAETRNTIRPIWRNSMLVLITYDVSVIADGGQRRLRRIAKVCQDYGMRVQNSVFECDIDPAQLVELKTRLLKIFDPDHDSLRFYFLGKHGRNKVEHVGAKIVPDVVTDALIL